MAAVQEPRTAAVQGAVAAWAKDLRAAATPVLRATAAQKEQVAKTQGLGLLQYMGCRCNTWAIDRVVANLS